MFGRSLSMRLPAVRRVSPGQTTMYSTFAARSALSARSIVPVAGAGLSITTRGHAFFSQRGTSRDNRGRRLPPPPSVRERIRRNVDKIKEGGVGPIASLGLGASVLFGKAKYVLVALKLTKLTPFISMAVSAGAYAMFFGWPYACGMVGLIFVHELGHAVAMRHYGVPFSPMVFVPFMGAVIGMQENPRSATEEAVIALGGPVLGSVGAVSLALAAPMVASPSTAQLLHALADWGYMINLFNLLPIGSMDGGRITAAISPWIGVAGLAGGGVLIAQGVIQNPLFYIIMLTGAYSTGSKLLTRYRTGSYHGDGWEDGKGEWYYSIPASEKAAITAAYFGLIAALIAGMAHNNKHRKTPRQLVAEEQARSGAYSTPRMHSGGVLSLIDELGGGDQYTNDIERYNGGRGGGGYDYSSSRPRRRGYFDDDDDY